MKTIKIKGKAPYGVIVAESASKYLEFAVQGVEKVLIVADETVFKLYGNDIKKIIKKAEVEVFTFIYPSGESGRTKHVSDKLIILMTELGIKKTDCVIAFGGRSSASLVGFATAIFNGGVPYMFVPTTLMGMLNPVADGKVGVDFLGAKGLLSATNYPVAVFVDTDYLKSLPQANLRDGYAEIIRRGVYGSGKLIELMEQDLLDYEEIIYLALAIDEKSRNSGLRKKRSFALNFSAKAEKLCGPNMSYDRLIAFGIITAIDTSMALGISYGLEEPMLSLLDKYGVRWDIGVSIHKLWQAMGESEKRKITVVLPKKFGKTRVVRLTKEKIKESF